MSIEILVSCIEFIVEKTPIIGGLKQAIEKDYPFRELSYDELISPKWVFELTKFLNDTFVSDYSRTYSENQIRDWIGAYNNTFLVIVKKKLISWPLNSEKIAATVKILPLREDYCVGGNFESYDVKPSQLVSDENEAKAVWIGDLVSKDNNLLILFLALGYKLENIEAPVYCRTVIKQLRSILMERYGAKIINPTGSDATKASILVLEPSSLKRKKKLALSH